MYAVKSYFSLLVDNEKLISWNVKGIFEVS